MCAQSIFVLSNFFFSSVFSLNDLIKRQILRAKDKGIIHVRDKKDYKKYGISGNDLEKCES